MKRTNSKNRNAKTEEERMETEWRKKYGKGKKSASMENVAFLGLFFPPVF